MARLILKYALGKDFSFAPLLRNEGGFVNPPSIKYLQNSSPVAKINLFYVKKNRANALKILSNKPYYIFAVGDLYQ